MWKLLVPFFVCVATHAYKLIEGTLIERPFVFAPSITVSDKQCITQAIRKFNNVKTITNIGVDIVDVYPCTDCNVIDYTNPHDSMFAYSVINGFYGRNSQWNIFSTDIFVNRHALSVENACNNLVLHELGHCKGLQHSTWPNSIMNKSVIVNNGELVAMPEWNLHADDIYALYLSSKRSEKNLP